MPLLDDVESFFEREVKPHVPDAWIDSKRRDPHDGKVGLVGYEINFNRYFYEIPTAPSLGGDRGRHPAGGEGDRGDAGRDARLTPARLRRLRAKQTERRLSPLPVSLLRAIHSS